MSVATAPPQPYVTARPISDPWPGSADLLSLAFYVLAAVVLLAGGYPTERVASLALPALAHQAQRLELRRRMKFSCANLDLRLKARRKVLQQLPLLVSTAAATALTGGVASPLLPTAVVPYVAALLVVGDVRETRALLVASAAAMCGSVLLPAAWAGPPLLPRFAAVGELLGVAGVGVLLAPFHSLVQQVRADLQRAREELASDALARARCLEQVGTRVAHELRNPLSAVKALVQLLGREAQPPAAQERLRVIEAEVARIQQILAEYLSFHHPLQELHPRPTELGALVTDALLSLSPRADRKEVRLTSRGEASIRADPRRLKEVLMDLVDNAIVATPPSGEVAVEIRSATRGAVITVRDWGVGMSAETLRRIGTPFFTTREEGTGLGVVLARAIVEQHGGSLRYDSAPGQGTTAMLWLPADPPQV